MADAIDLLDLVRSSEEGATVATTPAKEDFVEVGEDAVDVAPSLPPLRAASKPPSAPPPRSPSLKPAGAAPQAPKARPPEATEEGMSPAVSILLVVAITAAVLYAVVALPAQL